MTGLILLTTRAPHPLADDLMLAGYRVFEALAISEVLALVERHPDAHIISTAGVDPERARVVQHRYPTLQLNPEATAQDIVWELSLYCPPASSTTQ